jgi:hypothetical protein
MAISPKKLVNAYSSGNGGVHFESRVVASFVSVMLSRGMCPGLDGCRINWVASQNRYRRVQTDDVLVHATHLATDKPVRLYGQVKHRPAIRKDDKQFLEVIAAAWHDFINTELFNKKYDVIALITGPLSEKEGRETRDLLEHARLAGSEFAFYEQLKPENFISKGAQKRLRVFEHAVHVAIGKTPTRTELYEFLRCFRILGYDLDIQAGVTLALIQSLIGLATYKDPDDAWRLIHDHVQHAISRAGEFVSDEMPRSIMDLFSAGAL